MNTPTGQMGQPRLGEAEWPTCSHMAGEDWTWALSPVGLDFLIAQSLMTGLKVKHGADDQENEVLLFKVVLRSAGPTPALSSSTDPVPH